MKLEDGSASTLTSALIICPYNLLCNTIMSVKIYQLLLLLQLILSLKLSEIEQFEKQAENCLFANKIEFFGKWLHPRAKLKKTDPT